MAESTQLIERLELINMELELVFVRLHGLMPLRDRLTDEEKARSRDFQQQTSVLAWKTVLPVLPPHWVAEVHQLLYEVTNFINGVERRLQEV